MTVWKYSSWKESDTWIGSGEWNEEWDFLGYLDLSKVKDGGLALCT